MSEKISELKRLIRQKERKLEDLAKALFNKRVERKNHPLAFVEGIKELESDVDDLKEEIGDLKEELEDTEDKYERNPLIP